MRILVTGGSGFIGTNLTEALIQKEIDFLNVDLATPKEETLLNYWKKCSILDYEQLEKIFSEYKPTAVIHLAAETDTDPSRTMEDYKVNTEGTQNIIKAIQATPSVERFVLTSTQFVNQSQEGPKHDQDYAPHTVYGKSKIKTEEMLRSASVNCIWTIIRPTNIWGPWHLRYPFEFWKVLAEGKYFHPGKQKVIRSYGYVGNVVGQIIKILTSSRNEVDRKVYYVGDRPIDLYDWVNGFSLGQIGKKVVVLPRFFVRTLALIGDALRIVKIKFPITSSRYRSMTTNNPADMEKTYTELGQPPYTLQQGIDQTIEWMKKKHPELIKVK